MGITYFALPLPAKLVDIATINPGAFLADSLFWRTWPPPGARPNALYLEKTWRDLQWLLAGNGREPPRAAYELVRGDVTFTTAHYSPFERVLNPAQVVAAAHDLSHTDLAELYRRCLPQLSPDWADIMAQRQGSTASYLADATVFTARLAKRGLGLIYSIG